MKLTVVGDVHGKVEVVERALALDGPIVFVGDIADSFDRSITDHLKCFELIFKAIASNKAQCLYGNHELSYLIPQHRSSGFNPAFMSHVIGGLGNEINKRFKHYILYKPNCLITHAGLTNQIYNKYKLSPDIIEETLNDWCRDLSSPAHWIGRYRGGADSVGGIYWCDWNHEFIEVPELIQVFGHTRLKQGQSGNRGHSFCIDTNDLEGSLPFELEL